MRNTAYNPVRLIARLARHLRDRVHPLRTDSAARITVATLKKPDSIAAYWTRHNVTSHQAFRTASESLEYFWWRSDQYPGYIDLMPVAGQDGKVVLDYGCGPGNDLVGFAEYSRPAKLIGIDVSPTSLEEAGRRTELHGIRPELHVILENSPTLPLADQSVDYVHSSGVLHHVPDPVKVLRELRRVLKPDGQARVMVYNYDSLWLHLRAAYLFGVLNEKYATLTVRETFARSTDGDECPISRVYTPGEFRMLAEEAGFACSFLGAAISLTELDDLGKLRWDAMMSPRLAREHRQFLIDLRFDERGIPLHGNAVAGVDACFLLSPRG